MIFLADASTQVPMITDWITAVGVLVGLPAATWGIFKLFIKDKQREAEIDALKSMVKELEEQTISMRQQTYVLFDQLKRDKANTAALHRPFLKLEHGVILKEYFTITLRNFGKTAYFVGLENEKNFEQFQWTTNLSYPKTVIEADATLQLAARYLAYDRAVEEHRGDARRLEAIELAFPSFSEKFQFDIVIQDAVGNLYRHTVSGNENSYTPFVLGSMEPLIR